MRKIKCWIEAMRLRTLPVSLAGVILAIGFAIAHGEYEMTPAWLCVVFALLAQIASNFANEYYDFKSGLDKKGRVGPRRGVTEGDITPQAMKIATYATLAAACVVGCLLINWSGWWLIGVGALIAVGVIAYSSGPYPLSRHGLGEVAVLFFFGVIPVNFTYYLMTQDWNIDVLLGSIAAGLMGANVLLVNNYRDYYDDKAVNKQTLAVKLGRQSATRIYALNGLFAVIIFMHNTWLEMPRWTLIFPIIYLLIHSILSINITRKEGRELNPFLGMTAMAMLYYCLSFTLLQL
jgi:1,4-dihydroxy-2-naphthoate octaprenyltransferase